MRGAFLWLPVQVWNSLTEVKRYKWDTKSVELDVSHIAKKEGRIMTKNGQKPHKFTDEELKRLVQYFEILIEIDQAEKARLLRLEKEPKGFSMPGEGRSCSLCRQSIHNEGFFDKWGFKCLNCQNAIDKRIIPGSVCRDWDNKKSIADTSLAMELGININKIRKMIRNGEIVARKIPNGPYIVLQKDNPKKR